MKRKKRKIPAIARARATIKPAHANLSIIKAFWTQQGLPLPLAEFQFHLDRKWRFDFAWPAQKVALEVDGGIWIKGRHNQGAAMKNQWEKENEANIAGWHILKCEPKEVLTVNLVNLLRRALKV